MTYLVNSPSVSWLLHGGGDIDGSSAVRAFRHPAVDS